MVLTLILFAVIGAFAGLSAGLLGIGGGIIVVPGLAFIFGSFHFPNSIIMHMAAGTSLAAMIFTASASVYSHHKRGAVLWPLFYKMLPGILVGVIAGAILADILSSHILEIIFGIFLIIIAVRMFLLAKPKPTRGLPGPIWLSVISFVVGFKSGLMGIGGGALIVPILTYCNVPMRQASGTSAICGLPIAIVGTIAFLFTGLDAHNLPQWSTGYIYWPAALAVAIFSVIFVYVGGKLALRLPVNTLKRIFAVILAVMAIKLLV